ncbi:putative alcohol dehydrogenase [Xylariaceae sp. FL0016]|nr:putative alcohol dehydrogenase [Xylariaceae sp. FL0016]
MAQTQRALVVTELGKPVVLVHDREIPQPGRNQIQLKVTVAGVNPHDQKARDGGLFIANRLPAVLTNDAVGRVTKLGEGVSSDVIAVGDRVVAHPSFIPDGQPVSALFHGALQEYIVADLGYFAKIPDSVSDDQAATLPTNAVAPLVGLFDTLRIPAPWTPDAAAVNKDITLLIVGGGSNCGRFAVQLAKLAGVGRIVVVGGNEEELRGFGATHVLDRHGGSDAVLERIRAVVDDDLVYAFDAVSGAEGQIMAANALSSTKKGALTRLLPHVVVDKTQVPGKKAGFDVRDTFGASNLYPEVAVPFWERVPEYLESGEIKPLEFVVREGLLEENVNAVLDAYRDGKRVVKTHVHL